MNLNGFNDHWKKHHKTDLTEKQSEHHQNCQTVGLHFEAKAAGHFRPDRFNRLENPRHIAAIVRAALLSQSKDQNSSHVSKEQMSYQLGWCEHRYNADRKLRQSLVEPIMGRAVGAGLQTLLFLHCTALWCMINFLTKSTRQPSVCPLCRWQNW